MTRPALIAAAAAVLLYACGGGTTTGGGTADSVFVGTYDGTTTITVSTASAAPVVREGISLFVNPDGIVQIGNSQSTIYASGPLNGDRLHIDNEAAALVDPACSGRITISGVFSTGKDGAEFNGSWSSSDSSCFGVSGTISGSIEVERVDNEARASRVLETGSQALLQAFRRASD